MTYPNASRERPQEPLRAVGPLVHDAFHVAHHLHKILPGHVTSPVKGLVQSVKHFAHHHLTGALARAEDGHLDVWDRQEQRRGSAAGHVGLPVSPR